LQSNVDSGTDSKNVATNSELKDEFESQIAALRNQIQDCQTNFDSFGMETKIAKNAIAELERQFAEKDDANMDSRDSDALIRQADLEERLVALESSLSEIRAIASAPSSTQSHATEASSPISDFFVDDTPGHSEVAGADMTQEPASTYSEGFESSPNGVADHTNETQGDVSSVFIQPLDELSDAPTPTIEFDTLAANLAAASSDDSMMDQPESLLDAIGSTSESENHVQPDSESQQRSKNLDDVYASAYGATNEPQGPEVELNDWASQIASTTENDSPAYDSPATNQFILVEDQENGSEAPAMDSTDGEGSSELADVLQRLHSEDSWDNVVEADQNSLVEEPNEVATASEQYAATQENDSTEPVSAGNESVAEVLARMQRESEPQQDIEVEVVDDFSPETNNDRDKICQTMVLERPPVDESFVAEEIPVETVEPVQEEAIAPAGSNSPEDVSVQDYMSQLFTRLRGKAPEPQQEETTPQANQKPAEQSGEKDVATETALASQSELETLDPLSSEEFLPQQTAPERTKNMNALRELALASTRQALNVSNKKKSKTSQNIYLACIGGAAMTGVLLLMTGAIGLNLSTMSALIFFAAAGYCGYKFMDLTKKSKDPQPEESKAEAKETP